MGVHRTIIEVNPSGLVAESVTDLVPLVTAMASHPIILYQDTSFLYLFLVAKDQIGVFVGFVASRENSEGILTIRIDCN